MTRFAEPLLDTIADLARAGAAEPLTDALAELDRTVRLEGERLGREPGAGDRLQRLRASLLVLSGSFEAEQRQLGRELRAVQAEIQARARFSAPAPHGPTLDRRG